ncbi:MAG: hypothetical protein KKC66_05940, partial [Candidatus Omnitrophica bacterium]|nr:hypothetical protein [Candidatus Omnitrophota bacterium]
STRFIPSIEGEVLVIDIEWQGISVSQRWKFYFGDSNLFWDLSQHKSPEGAMEEFKVGLIVTDKYKRFFCGYQADNFPEESDEWQDMHIEDPYSELEGVRKIDKLPALALENINQCACLIQNGNALVKCRTLQMKIDNNAANKSELQISQKISIYENETPVIQHIQDSLAKHKKRLFEQYSIGTGPFRLFANPQAKVIHLYHNGRQITGGPHGFFFGLGTDPDNYDMSFLRDWQVERIDENFLRVVMTGQRAPKTEIFAFETNDEGIVIKLWMDNDTDFKLRDYHIKLELADNYKRWATSYGEGFLPEGQEWVNSIMPARLKENQIDNIILKPDGIDFPLLDIFCSFNTPRRFMSLYKRRQGDLPVVCLQYQFSFFDDESYYKSGSHDVFECTLTFQERGFRQNKDIARGIKLKNKDTSFIFARGLGRLFWKDREITNGLGVYSSLRSKGIWYDSSQAIWKTEKKTENTLVAYGRWLFLPIHQRWSIELKKDRILWAIDTEISGHIKPEIEQANIMTSDEYSEWSLSNGLKGRFDGFFTDDYDISPFRYCYVELESPLIRVSHANLPLLSFSCKNGKGLKAIVENSDVFYRSRIIQYQKTNDKNAADSDDKYKFFEGEIILK